MKKITKWRPRVRSKNHSCEGIRHMNNGLGFFPFKSLVRLGSRAPLKRVFPKSYDKAVELNTVEAIERSRNKLEMKSAFAEAEVPQSEWWTPYENIDHIFWSEIKGHTLLPRGVIKEFDESEEDMKNIPYPLIAKRVYGFKGKGMSKIDSKEDLEDWLEKHPDTDGWYFEEFHNYVREYRLHVTKYGCFYAARKMVKSDTPEDKKWFRNDSNCVWITEYTVEKDGDQIVGYDENIPNEVFDKPVNWDKIEADCVKALKSVGLDVGAFDVKIQSALDSEGNKREDPKYIIIEVNSAPSFGEITTIKYKEVLPKLLKDKYENN